MNVIMFAQTPGTDETASGIFSQRSGLDKRKQVGQPIVKIKSRKNQHEFCSIFPPDRFISVDEVNRYHYKVTLFDPISSTMTQKSECNV